MSDPDMIDGIQAAVSIPVMAKARIGHFVEAQVLQAIGVDYVDESEVLTPADYAHHIDKRAFTVPFVCGATNLGEALRRISEGAAMIRTKGEAGTGDVSQATTHLRTILGEIKKLTVMDETELFEAAKLMSAPVELVRETASLGRLPGRDVHRRRRGHPRRRGDDDAAGHRRRVHRLGHLQERRPGQRARACVEATAYFTDAERIAKVSRGLGEAMVGIAADSLGAGELLATAAGDGRLVTAPRIGVLALQGDVREHDRALQAAGAHRRRPPGRGPRRSWTAWSCRAASPRRSAGCCRSSSCSSRCGEGRRRPAGLRLLRRDDPAGPRRARRPPRRPGHRRARRRRPAQRLRPAGRQLRDRPALRGRRRRARRLHPRPVGGGDRRGRAGPRAGPGRAGEPGGGPAAGRVVAVRQGNVLATSFHPELTGDDRVHGLFVRLVKEAGS
jgi:pyridoxal 5'-phosphate synthase pdxS subunit